MQERKIEKQVKRLARQKKFEQIYQEFGPAYFRKYVSNRYANKDIKKLLKEEKYDEIYRKYGTISDLKEIRNELEAGTSTLVKVNTKHWIILYRILNKLTIGMAIVDIGLLTGGVDFIETDIEKARNLKKYEEQIKEYKDEIKEYSEKFNPEKQSDMEIIMRVMRDMHETIKGYDEPAMDIVGYRGMDVNQEGGIGVCRNMADNVVDKLNEINPEYNARHVSLYAQNSNYLRNNIPSNSFSEDGKRICNYGDVEEEYDKKDRIKKKVIQNEEGKEIIYYQKNGKKAYSELIEDGYETKIYYDKQGREYFKIEQKISEIEEGLSIDHKVDEDKPKQANHSMVAIDLKKEHVTLIIDPTWKGIGVYKDGKIEMFNEREPTEAVYERIFYSEGQYRGIKGAIEYPIDYVKSFIEPTLSMDELRKKYGVEAQNKMLEKIEREDNKKTFKEELKIDEGMTYDFDKNIVTIEHTKEEKEHE